MNHQKSGSRTLLWSVVMSAPGPLIVGAGLFIGQSNTQVADFVRRSSELLAIVLAYIIYRITTKDGNCDTDKKVKLERLSNLFVGAMMCLGGSIMFALAFVSENSDKGNVVPGLVIAILGVIANTIFWRKYARLNKVEPNAILAVQARLYRAKSFVDACVTAALLCVAIAPEAKLSFYVDLIGSAVVALYLVICGVRTIRERIKK